MTQTFAVNVLLGYPSVFCVSYNPHQCQKQFSDLGTFLGTKIKLPLGHRRQNEELLTAGQHRAVYMST